MQWIARRCLRGEVGRGRPGRARGRMGGAAYRGAAGGRYAADASCGRRRGSDCGGGCGGCRGCGGNPARRSEAGARTTGHVSGRRGASPSPRPGPAGGRGRRVRALAVPSFRRGVRPRVRARRALPGRGRAGGGAGGHGVAGRAGVARVLPRGPRCAPAGAERGVSRGLRCPPRMGRRSGAARGMAGREDGVPDRGRRDAAARGDRLDAQPRAHDRRELSHQGPAHRLAHGDPASNNDGWQWAASTGTDAQPYLRIFNPTLQGERFDPDGEYVRRWIPELAGMPGKSVHRPWASPLRAPACPPPIVDHRRERTVALAPFAAAAADSGCDRRRGTPDPNREREGETVACRTVVMRMREAPGVLEGSVEDGVRHPVEGHEPALHGTNIHYPLIPRMEFSGPNGAPYDETIPCSFADRAGLRFARPRTLDGRAPPARAGTTGRPPHHPVR